MRCSSQDYPINIALGDTGRRVSRIQARKDGHVHKRQSTDRLFTHGSSSKPDLINDAAFGNYVGPFQNFPLDLHLKVAEKAEIAAYESLLKLKLHPAYVSVFIAGSSQASIRRQTWVSAPCFMDGRAELQRLYQSMVRQSAPDRLRYVLRG